jgi:NTP pyrophosphatase (non-canonical NTP hydrolase)
LRRRELFSDIENVAFLKVLSSIGEDLGEVSNWFFFICFFPESPFSASLLEEFPKKKEKNN